MESPTEDQQFHGWSMCEVAPKGGKDKARKIQIVVERALHCLKYILRNNMVLLGCLDEEELFLINAHKLKPYLVQRGCMMKN
jgi:hypothetical protein